MTIQEMQRTGTVFHKVDDMESGRRSAIEGEWNYLVQMGRYRGADECHPGREQEFDCISRLLSTKCKGNSKGELFEIRCPKLVDPGGERRDKLGRWVTRERTGRPGG